MIIYNLESWYLNYVRPEYFFLLFLCFSIFIIGNLVISVIVEQVFII